MIFSNLLPVLPLGFRQDCKRDEMYSVRASSSVESGSIHKSYLRIEVRAKLLVPELVLKALTECIVVFRFFRKIHCNSLLGISLDHVYRSRLSRTLPMESTTACQQPHTAPTDRHSSLDN